MIDWKKNELLPVIIQDYKNKMVLMLAYMNEEAYNLTKETGYVHYFSRSKNRIWKKGEVSKHFQEVKEIFIDCDQDTILIFIKQNGVACHTGYESCFFKSITKDEIIFKTKLDLSKTYFH